MQETLRNQPAAALPWYDFPAVRPALDAVWREAREQLIAHGYPHTPASLDRSVGSAADADGSLVLSQCCGLDLFRPGLTGVTPVAAPIMTALDAPPGCYFSWIVSRRAAARRRPAIVAINDRYSHSGHTAIRAWLDERGCRDYQIRVTGSHLESVRALELGSADLASIDALSWRFLDARDLEVVGRSAAAPAPPFIAGIRSPVPPQLMATALDAGLRRFGQPLGITGALPVSRSWYAGMAAEARQRGVLTDV